MEGHCCEFFLIPKAFSVTPVHRICAATVMIDTCALCSLNNATYYTKPKYNLYGRTEGNPLEEKRCLLEMQPIWIVEKSIMLAMHFLI